MKIIGTTLHGYICEVGKDEMKLTTGKVEPLSDNSHAHRVGTVVNVIPVSRHASAMEYTIKQRKDSAETLRAVANIIETVPDAFTEPDEPKPATPENQI